MAITPTKEQFNAFARHDRDGEVVMINLLHFSSEDGDQSADGAEASSGSDAYRQYSDAAVEMVEARGGHVLWMGQPEHVLIGDTAADGWDMAVLVSYPSRAAFVDMVTSPSYTDAHAHRERGLDRTVLLACRPLVNRVDDHG
ncbi:MAG TPA: DUF1330 domain-containing protein [Acidimicrobiales bacterium]|jgi:uncharacterized protein (DUF1330 family)|nr:DUF1330 domain-containing protein [Acidimicrobiales bacterium]